MLILRASTRTPMDRFLRERFGGEGTRECSAFVEARATSSRTGFREDVRRCRHTESTPNRGWFKETLVERQRWAAAFAVGSSLFDIEPLTHPMYLGDPPEDEGPTCEFALEPRPRRSFRVPLAARRGCQDR